MRSPIVTPGMRRIERAIADAGGPLTVRQIAKATDRSVSTTWKHLQKMEQLGLVQHVRIEGYETGRGDDAG